MQLVRIAAAKKLADKAAKRRAEAARAPVGAGAQRLRAFPGVGGQRVVVQCGQQVARIGLACGRRVVVLHFAFARVYVRPAFPPFFLDYPTICSIVFFISPITMLIFAVDSCV